MLDLTFKGYEDGVLYYSVETQSHRLVDSGKFTCPRHDDGTFKSLSHTFTVISGWRELKVDAIFHPGEGWELVAAPNFSPEWPLTFGENTLNVIIPDEFRIA